MHLQSLLGGILRMKTISTRPVQIPRKHMHHLFSLISPDEKLADVKEFKALFPTIVTELTTVEKYKTATHGMKRTAEVLEYNMENVPVVQSLAFIDTYRSFAITPLSQENARLAYNMAWCLQLMELLIVMIDDLVNNVPKRRNREAWHLVGDNSIPWAANDTIIIEQCVYALLRNHFRDKSYYSDVVHTIHHIINTTLLGQNFDTELSNKFRRTRQLDIFTIDQLRDLIKYKSTPCTWHPSIIVGMLMNNIKSPDIRREVEGIVSQMTECFEYLENYVDCFGTREGHVGIDIKNGKCVWPICTALQMASPQQKSQLQECYGIPEKDKVDAVMKVYRDLGVQDLFKHRYNEMIRDIEKNIQQLSKDVPKRIFTNILKRAYYSRL